METPTTQNEYIQVKQEGPINDYEFFSVKKVFLILLITFSSVVIVSLFILLLIPGVPIIVRIVIPCSFIPSIIVFLLVPFNLSVRVDKLNRSITFSRRTFIPKVCNCLRKSYRIDDIQGFNVEFLYSTNKNQNYCIYANFKNGNPREVVYGGAGNGCSSNFNMIMENSVKELNRIITEVN